MSPDKLKRHYGSPVTGAHYWPRPDITEPIVASLRAGESVKLFGLRRAGKSSVMLAVEEALAGHGLKPVYVDVQGHDRIDKLLSALLAALPDSDAVRQISRALSPARLNQAVEFFNMVRGKAADAPASPTAVLHQVELVSGDLTKVLAQQNGSVVLLIDELPFLIDNMLKRGVKEADVNGFLATLRSWRQDGRVPMLLSGSMGLSWLIRERGIAREHFNDLIKGLTPPPLEADDARAMLEALATEEGCTWLTDELLNVVLQELAVTYPSFIQFAFGRLKDNKAHTPDDVRRVFTTHIRPSLDEDFYAQFDTRMNRFEANDKAMARDVLRCIDKAGEAAAALPEIDRVLGSHAASDRDEILTILIEDGFLSVDTRAQTASFSSPLVRTWWQSKPYRR
ncbi:hypothetical protein [Rhodopseudomonas sp. WA056]|uniref:hypothetical protein n=1 Tax=Rhodopseudomonas sp. WA056 TaxID=2269367 RepID=UPI0013DFE53C|nr:hypothetical protein [Rhodopseudomonas sp. WA056]